MTHEDLRDLIPAYALDALEPDETIAVEAHLGSCDACRRELALLQEAAASLGTGVTQTPPPQGLRARVMEAANPAGRSAGRRAVPAWSWAPALWAAAAVIVMVVGISLYWEQRVSQLNARVEEQGELIALLASPSAKTVALAGTAPGTVRFVFDPTSRRGILVAAGLRDLGRDLVYQVWLVAGDRPESAGVFRPEPGAPTVVTVGADFTRYRAVAISVERGPRGAPAPTAAPILVGALPGSS